MLTNDTSREPRIIVGVDGSESSVAALRWAVRQARLTGVVVEAVIAWQIPASATGYGFAPISGDSLSYLKENAKQVLAGAISKATGPQDTDRVHSVVTQAIPGEALTEASADADLLVVGSRGHGGMAGALLGSVSQYCVHHAHCPVVVIRGMAAHTRAA
jgi:nucleotide-binding universal stress UspA family protein